MIPTDRRTITVLAELKRPLVALTVVAMAQLVAAEQARSDDTTSLIKTAPTIYYLAKRHDKFFGDANTVDGDLFARSYLFGDFGGARQDLADKGLYLDLGVTQSMNSVIYGGEDQKTGFVGSTDAWAWFDTGQAGLWPGGAVFLYGEGRWGGGANKHVGSLLPANNDQSFPDTDPDDPNWALSEFYVMQALPNNFLAAAGKMNFASYGDTNALANRERSEFLHSGLVVNPIPGAFFPYTTFIAWLNWSPNPSHSLTGVYGHNDGEATDFSGTFDLDTDETSLVFQYEYKTQFAGKPTGFMVDTAWSNLDLVSFDISEQQLFESLIGIVPIEQESENYAVTANFSQYLWVKESTTGLPRSDLAPRGVGVFGRFGWAPEDRNVINQFYSLGIRGNGALIPSRDDDMWGVGWAGTRISSDLRDLRDDLRTWEHAFEVFYNYSLTPAMHLSAHTQAIRPISDDLDTAWVLGLRLQADF